ncbi:MAG TPA: ABC transporter permease, partial [Parafilimonas sp.]|nr:ABC transporter permease [Parafilimonas sp.]
MFKNYFKTAWRNIIRNKVFSIINVLGLALGLCACIVIYVICSFEFSFDNFHPGKENIYRVMGDVTENSGNKLHFGRLPIGVSEFGRSELSTINNIAGIIPYNADVAIPERNKPLKHFDSRTSESHFVTTVLAQPQYFSIFKYQWLAGDAVTALNAPLKVVLTKNRAQQYFGNEPLNNIIGKQIIYDDSLTATVSGIIKDWVGNTDLGFTDFISFSTLQTNFLKSRIDTDSWAENFMNTWTFVKLSAGSTPVKLNDQLQALVKRHAAADVHLALWLEPLSDMHFNADVIENSFRTANKTVLYYLMVIGLFILILAIINFINLSTAQSVQRAKEVGVRKVLGSSRSGLVFQFLSETFVVTFIAVLLAVLLVNPVLAAFHSFIPHGITFNFFDLSTIIFLSVVTLFTSLLAGFYPAKVLSAHLPVQSLKGLEAHAGSEKWLLRKGLIVFQFTVSLAFIIGSIVIANQLQYTREKNPGFNSAAIIIVPTPWDDSLSKISVLANEIRKMSSVNDVALQWLPPMTDNARSMALKLTSTGEKEVRVGQVAGNENFIPLYHIKLLAGRNLIHADSVKEYVINESFLNSMGYKNPQDAIGKMLYWNDEPHPIVGVVADFHIASFHDPITPLCIINRPDREKSLAIKLATKNKNSDVIKLTLSLISRAWKQLYPAGTFNYEFYDESLAMLYEKDQQTATLVNTATAITIFISCIGLFGLILFTSEKRSKEISIRKILGAGIGDIVMLLSKDFILMVIIALLIASPVAWYFMNKWLQTFAYRINITPFVFVIAGFFVFAITIATISF